MSADPVAAACGEVLRVTDLCVDFLTEAGWTRVVDGVSFVVPERCTVGLVGESGSGKTVTSLALMGLMNRKEARVWGSVKLDGRELVGLSESDLGDIRGREIAMVFQEPRRSLDPAFTVGRQIADVVRRHRGVSRHEADRVAEQMLDTVGISNARLRMHDYPHQFSGGMCQRVMLALALACRPRVLIADEPTTALDVTVQKKMLQLMRELQNEFAVSILFITHDLGVVSEMCDLVNVMYAGQIVESATVDELFFDPRHPYTDGLLRSVPDIDSGQRRFNYIGGAVPRPQDWSGSCRFNPRCAHMVRGRCDVEEVPLIARATHPARCLRDGELSLSVIP